MYDFTCFCLELFNPVTWKFFIERNTSVDKSETTFVVELREDRSLVKRLFIVSPKRDTVYLLYLAGSFQLTFNCSKSTTETLEKGVKHVQS